MDKLKKAIDYNDTEIICQLLPKTNQNIPLKIFYYAIESNNIQIISFLLNNYSVLVHYFSEDKESPLLYAMRLLKLDIVKCMLDYCVATDINRFYYIPYSYHIFTYVYKNNLVGIAKMLVERGFDINARGFLGDTAYIKYSTGITDEIVYDFIENGAKINAISEYGDKLLTLVLLQFDQDKNINLIYYLIEKGATIDGSENYIFTQCIDNTDKLVSIINLTAKIGIKFDLKELIENKLIDYPRYHSTNIETIKIVLSSGININYKNKEGATLLHIACLRGDADCVNFLLDYGADVNAKDIRGKTPLYYIMNNIDNHSIIRILINNGADPMIICKNGNCILHNISRLEDTSLMILLIEQCISYINLQNDLGLTPLAESLKSGCSTKYIRLLLEYGADINILDNENTPIIHHINMRAESISLLLQYGADINTMWNGETLLYRCVTDYIQLSINDMIFLIENNADVTLTYYDGNTLLHILAKKYYFHCDSILIFIDKLLEYGADINALNDNGETPLAIANKSLSNISSHLIKNGGIE